MSFLQCFVFSPFQENTYVIWDDTQEAVIIDPGCLTQREKETLKQFISDKNLQVVGLWQTHAHLDHVFGSAYVKRIFNVPMYLHPLDNPLLADAELRCKAFGIEGFEPVQSDIELEHGMVLTFGQTRAEVVHVPGHAPGHVAFIFHDDRWILGGDCLFKESVGRTDFPLCSHIDLMQSIQTHFYTLPDDYVVYAGHMEPTTIGHEKKYNPFVKA
ncbi:MAG: MBL fold metallo-hydrolase [Spirosomataceae bacterium]